MAKAAAAKSSAAKASGKTAEKSTIVSLKVTLKGIKPPIWRRLLVAESMTLVGLHEAIQAGMGWLGGHLHSFDIDGEEFGDPKEFTDVADQRRVTLARLVKSGTKRFTYTYDFGDDWEHLVVIEKILSREEGQVYPLCRAGARACPPEDSGGPWGYPELLDVLADPDHPDHAEQSEWVEEGFDPEAFSIEVINARLRARFA